MTNPSPTATSVLMARYHAKGDSEARAQLLDRHLGLVYHVAHQIAATLPDEVELHDLISSGTLGLVRALASFDPSRGLQFSTYATVRIRGAILDDLRQRDWVPRSVRQKSRRLSRAVAELESQLRRAPDPAEVAAVLTIDLETYWRWRAEVDGGVMVAIDEPPGQTPDGLALSETVSNPLSVGADGELEQQETVDSLREAIGALPEKERAVLALYYYEEMNLREIAGVLHLTESRISQIRTQALRRLRTLLDPATCGRLTSVR